MKTFDERAKDWDSDPTKVQRAGVLADAIRATGVLRAGMTALEYGCGTGLLSFALQADFASITLVDTSQGMLDVLAEKIRSAGVENMHPLRLDLASDLLPASRFSITYSLLTMHHIPDTALALKHFHELLEPQGILCIADLEKEDGSFHGPDVKDVHLGFERPALQRQVENAGFNRVEYSHAFDVRKQVDGREKAFPVFLLVARAK